MGKAAIYLRVSTEEQAEKGFSLQAQRYECMQKAKELGCEEIAEFCDEGVSGSIIERPMLLSALEAIKQRKIDYFLCYDPSRLSRNVSHQLILIDNIKKYNTKLIFIRGSFDDTAEGRFQLTIMAAVDEYERSRIKIRTELGKRAKAKSKQLTHNPNLYGYIFDKDKDCLYINEAQAAIVKKIFDWLINEGIGPAKISHRLNELSIPSMRGKEWSRVAVNRILNNYSYTGAMYIRRYDTKDYKLNKYKKNNDRISITERPRDQWIEISIPEIINKRTWDSAKILMDKSKRIYKSKASSEYKLSGLLKCGICGGNICGKTISKVRYYCCTNKYNYSLNAIDRCSSTLYKAEKLENDVWKYLKKIIVNKTEIENAIDLSLYYNEEKKISDGFENKNEQIKSMLDEIGKDNIIEVVEKYLYNISALEVNKVISSFTREIIITNNIVILKTIFPKHIIEKAYDFHT